MKVVALVPMRARSERVPGKNTRLFAGRPLYHRIVETLLAVDEIDSVWIDTDSEAIAEEAPRMSDRVRVIDRPETLRNGMIPMNEVLLHDVTQVDADLYLQTHSTNPLLTAKSVRRALRLLRDSLGEYDSLFSVTKLQTRLWDEDCSPVNHDPNVLLRTQDLAPLFEENSNIYIFDRKTLQQRTSRIGHRPLMFEIDRIEAWDIDEEEDFRIAEALFDLYARGGG